MTDTQVEAQSYYRQGYEAGKGADQYITTSEVESMKADIGETNTCEYILGFRDSAIDEYFMKVSHAVKHWLKPNNAFNFGMLVYNIESVLHLLGIVKK